MKTKSPCKQTPFILLNDRVILFRYFFNEKFGNDFINLFELVGNNKITLIKFGYKNRVRYFITSKVI